MKKSLCAAALTAALALTALTGCASGAEENPAPAATQEAAKKAALAVDNAWVKAAEKGMSAVFGELINHTDADIVVTGATSDASSSIELHETVANADGQMVMQEIDGGFVVPAGGRYLLEPGGNHIMLMGLEKTIKAGDELSFTLATKTGPGLTFTAVAKDYAGANESYVGDHDMHSGEHADTESSEHNH